MADSKRIIAELKRRAAAKQAAVQGTIKVEDVCFDKQIAFIKDPSRFKSAVCSRRAGKTVSCAVDLLVTASSLVGDVAYITVNRRSAKKIIWRDLLKYNKEFKLGGHPDNTELTLKMPNGSMIHLYGAKDESDAEKIRGMSFRKVYIDEAQSFRPYLADMIEDIVEPALTDYYGQLVLIGTPGPVPVGYFHDISTGGKWSNHHWTMQDNPHIKLKSGKDPLEIIKELADRRGLSLDSPSILREYYGRWVKDTDSLVYRFDPDRNIFTGPLPADTVYIFGIDIGWKDSDAIAVLGYSSEQQRVYLVEEYVRDKNDITSLANQIKAMQQQYNPVKMIMDAGALGKKIQEEIRVRHLLPVQAAEKSRKSEYIALLNDDLRTGRLLAKPGSRFEEDSYLLQWDYSNPERPVIDSRYHTDIGDAVLYAWRECRHYYERDAAPQAKTPDQYMLELEEREAAAMEASKTRNDSWTDVTTWDDMGIPSAYDYEVD